MMMMAASSAVSAIGTMASGQAAADMGFAEQRRLQAEGMARKQMAEYEAAQLDIQANDEKASGQREAQQLRREKKLALSRLQAVGAGSGFSATDPTSLGLSDEIEKYGTYREQVAMQGGIGRESQLESAAAARRFSGDSALASAYASGDIAAAEGRAKRTASYFSAAGTILGGASSMAEKYAKQKPVYTTGGRYG